ncbi:hypothetical protein GCM10009425_40350 [Pseudomonas asuensis]|uniref:Transposase n=1 Tax=Pseudomonas asuensis TaxID=1825787 RepID=A0ABQ2H2D4_9PSED|nr:hypothetical protein GCM10009425_40350 [Pseudomonas asuensis]
MASPLLLAIRIICIIQNKAFGQRLAAKLYDATAFCLISNKAFRTEMNWAIKDFPIQLSFDLL